MSAFMFEFVTLFELVDKISLSVHENDIKIRKSKNDNNNFFSILLNFYFIKIKMIKHK